mgnify:CR=1 FL=1
MQVSSGSFYKTSNHIWKSPKYWRKNPIKKFAKKKKTRRFLTPYSPCRRPASIHAAGTCFGRWGGGDGGACGGRLKPPRRRLDVEADGQRRVCSSLGFVPRPSMPFSKPFGAARGRSRWVPYPPRTYSWWPPSPYPSSPTSCSPGSPRYRTRGGRGKRVDEDKH